MDKPDHVTISMTDRPPVKIRRADWPLVASAKQHDGGRGLECQANRQWAIYVRQHADGRSLVSGAHSSRWQGEPDGYGGEIVEPGGDVPAAIRRIGERIGAGDSTIDRCIADLPAVEL